MHSLYPTDNANKHTRKVGGKKLSHSHQKRKQAGQGSYIENQGSLAKGREGECRTKTLA